jgi:hypothetical protein
LEEVVEFARDAAQLFPESFASGLLNLSVGRCALALGDEANAQRAVERAALSGDHHGWVFPDRQASRALWQLALKSGDSRVVRYAERVIALVAEGSVMQSAIPSVWPAPATIPSPPRDLETMAGPIDGEALVYVTTAQGVTRMVASEIPRLADGADLVVNTLAHALRIAGREVSLERRRALEPLVVQLLRRAREGLTAEEILRAAGGPGPESADAEHRVRVLISRVRDILGHPTTIERVRDAGEHGKTRYRIAANVRFALVEPLFSPTIPP